VDARGEYTPCPPSSRACAPLTDAGWNTTGDVCSGTFAHLARARARWKRGKPLLPWKVCLCFLGWSASSHELESARRRAALAAAAGEPFCALPSSRRSMPAGPAFLCPPRYPSHLPCVRRSIARQVIFDPSCKVHASAGAQISPADLQV
jgi:hypothetical protein